MRIYRLADYLGEGMQVEVTVDASPTALGGYLKEDDCIVEFFEDAITEHDQAILNAAAGGSEGQQIWEALAMLCALRLWAPRWRSRRVRLRVKGDNVSALVMIVRMKAKGASNGLIARELALDIAEALYEPQVCSHMPGISNVIADYLSRMRSQGQRDLLAPLRHARQRWLPGRDVGSWWRTL